MEAKKLMVINSADGQCEEILGKYMYYSLPKLAVKREKVEEICKQLKFPVKAVESTSLTDAFRSATGDIYDRKEEVTGGGVTIHRIYCRDNKRVEAGTLSRELVDETLHENTNSYRKLANITFDKSSGDICLVDMDVSSPWDVYGYYDKAVNLFGLYRDCISNSGIETMADKYIAGMHATGISARGHHYFVPKAYMWQIDLLEDFMEAVAQENLFVYSDGRNSKYVSINSMYVADDEKQRRKMANEFYIDIGKRIDDYQERIEHLIRSGSTSAKILDRWELKLQGLEARKREYEAILRQDLSGMDEKYSLLRDTCDQFRLRVRNSQVFGAMAA